MVVSALVQLAIAGPVGILFGLGYGTAIRVGYEQVYPALFGDKSLPKDTETILKKLETFYTTVGGLEAHKFGINQGIKNALRAIDADSELVDLIKKNSSLDSQNITVNLSGISAQTQNLGPSGKSSVFSPPFQSSGLLNYVAALAKAEEERDVNAYASIIDQIGLSRFNIFKLVRDGHVTVETGGFTVRIEFGLLSLTKQREYAVIHNQWNEAAIAQNKTKTNVIGLPPPQKVIKFKAAAGQSQKLEKTKLFGEIRQMQSLIRRYHSSTAQYKVTHKKDLNSFTLQLKDFQQKLANLLERYRF